MDSCRVKGCTSRESKFCKSCGTKQAFNLINTFQPEQNNIDKYIEVRFKGDRKELFLNKSSKNLNIGDSVKVKLTQGWDIGMVSSYGVNVEKMMSEKRIKNRNEEFNKDNYILNTANYNEIQKWQENIKKEAKVLVESRKLIKKHKLGMKLSDVEYQADGQKIIFYYVADDRVDFRELLKDIISEFKKKIELRQIGHRQEASKVGGIGSCGLELCCSSWLKDFRSVNIDTIRTQQLSINSDKITGVCGKLKCCMNYEYDSYVEQMKKFPNKKTYLKTKKGNAKMIKIDVFKELVWYVYINNEKDKNAYMLKLNNANLIIEKNKKGLAISSLEDISEKNND